MARFVRLFLSLGIVFSIAVAVHAEVLGQKPDASKRVALSEILAKPADYIGKEVVVEGIVVNVCAARGCWMELAGSEPMKTLRVKVDDGVMVFPMSARGRKAVAVGRIEGISGAYKPKDASCPTEAAIQLRATGAELQ